MVWKEIRNNYEPDFRDDFFLGECPRFHKNSKIVVHTVGKKICKTDLQNTYRKISAECSLIEVECDFCIEHCPLVTEKY